MGEVIVVDVTVYHSEYEGSYSSGLERKAKAEEITKGGHRFLVADLHKYSH